MIDVLGADVLGLELWQVVLVLLLSAYVATLLWMRQMALGKPLPRILGCHGGAR